MFLRPLEGLRGLSPVDNLFRGLYMSIGDLHLGEVDGDGDLLPPWDREYRLLQLLNDDQSLSDELA